MYKKEIQKLINEMTTEEKTRLLCACSMFETFGCERLGIEGLKTMDGPNGLRADAYPPNSFAWNPSHKFDVTALPTYTALASTWNKNIAEVFGETLGSEARARGKDIILGPGVNIIRHPLSGRNFEYLSEDPVLAGELGKNIVKGIQKNDVAACVKHIAVNNQELDRGRVNIKVSDRALHEIYLKALKTSIMDGEALSVMGSTNQYNNEHCSHNKKLTKEILKDLWGFKGIAMTDWGAAHDTYQAIYNGLDMEMNTSANYWEDYHLGKEFAKRAEQNPKEMKLLNDKVSRILYVMFNINKFSKDRKKGEKNTKEHQNTALQVAEEAMVLLKNEDSILPLSKDIKNVLVIGENANRKHARGGGSSSVAALYEVTLLEGIKNKLGNDINLEYIETIYDDDVKSIPVEYFDFANRQTGYRGFEKRLHHDNHIYGGEYDVDYTLNPCIDYESDDGKPLKFVGAVTLPEDGVYNFVLTYDARGWLKLDDVQCGQLTLTGTKNSKTVSINGKKGQRVLIEIALFMSEKEKRYLRLGWSRGNDESGNTTDILKKVQKADKVIFCGGLSHDYDTEGYDKKDMSLPAYENILIEKILNVNPETIIVITAGSAVEMPWFDKAKAVLWTWYAGMEMGNAFANILFGDKNPSGKLPMTFPIKYEDTPVYRYGEYKDAECEYKDDIFVGYRGYEKDNIKPLLPFGYGLSYTTFDYLNLSVNGNIVKCDIQNVGNRVGKEIVQLYIGVENTDILHPVKELKDFCKVELNPQETKTVEFEITEDMLTYYDEEICNWEKYKGDYRVYIGSSVSDIRLHAALENEIH